MHRCALAAKHKRVELPLWEDVKGTKGGTGCVGDEENRRM